MKGTAGVKCYGTIWVGRVGTAGETIPVAPPNGAPQFVCPGLDASLLGSCHLIMHPDLKLLMTRGLKAFREEASKPQASKRANQQTGVSPELTAETARSVPKPPQLRRIAGSSYRVSQTYHVYEIGDEFCKQLAALDSDRIKQIYEQWETLWESRLSAPEPIRGEKHRGKILTQLVELARVAVAEGGRLFLRVDYRAVR